MFVTSQALTKQIGLLEEEVGGKLFERSARGVTLTPLGEYAFNRFARLDGQLQDTLLELKHRSGEEKKQIRIGIFSSLPRESFITPLLTYLLGTHADCSFHLEMSGVDEGRQRIIWIATAFLAYMVIGNYPLNMLSDMYGGQTLFS